MVNPFSYFLKADGKAILLIGLLCFVAFSPALFGQFKGMDDDFSIVSNADLRSTANIPKIFTSGYFKSRDYYRPLVNLSYMAEYHAFGLQPFFYNLDDILLHVLNAILVFFLAGMLLGDRKKAFWVALLFAVHPLQWEAVGNISGRAILLCAACVLGAFILFLKYLKEQKPDFLLGATVCFVLGLLCKESAAILLPVLAVYVLLTGSKAWRALIPFAVVVIVYLLWRNHLGLTHVFPWNSGRDLFLGFTSFLNGLFTYARLILVPAGLYFDRSAPLFTMVLSPAVMITWAAYGLAGWAAWSWRRAFTPLGIFCAAWFFMELLPVAQIVTSIGVQAGTISLAEHFLYMPLIPALVLLVARIEKLAAWLDARGIIRMDVSRLVAGGVILFFIITAMQQSFYASNEAAMLKQSLAANPRNARLQATLGMVYVRAEDYPKAEAHFREAVTLDAGEMRYRISLGKSMADQGRYQEALEEYARIENPGGWKTMLEQNIISAQTLMKK